VKAGETEKAINLYRRIVTEFPESQFAPVCLFNIAAIYDGRADLPATISTLRELVKAYPNARESVDGHLYIAALQSDHDQFADALVTVDEILPRTNLTYADRIEALARKGYILIELHRYEDAQVALDAAVAEWKKAPHLEDPYYIAMASYYRGELAHKKFQEAPVRLPDDQEVADLEAKRVLAVLGNHDYFTWGSGVARALASCGYEVLKNQTTISEINGAPLALVGVDDPVTRHDDFDAAFKGANGYTKVVLCHAPDAGPMLAERGADLVLSGHTHGGQIYFKGITDRILRRIGLNYRRGMFTFGDTTLNVTPGVGFSGIPRRIGEGTEAEVAVLTLRAA
jgi:predicted phosphodiesterase